MLDAILYGFGTLLFFLLVVGVTYALGRLVGARQTLLGYLGAGLGSLELAAVFLPSLRVTSSDMSRVRGEEVVLGVAIALALCLVGLRVSAAYARRKVARPT